MNVRDCHLYADDLAEHMMNVLGYLYLSDMGHAHGRAAALGARYELLGVLERIAATGGTRERYRFPPDWRATLTREIGAAITAENRRRYGERFSEYFNEDGSFKQVPR